MRTIDEIRTSMSKALELPNTTMLMELAEEAAAIGTDLALATSHDARGLARLNSQDTAGALPAFEQALAIYTMLDDRHRMGVSEENIGHAHQRLGSPEQALASYERSLAHFESTGNSEAVTRVLLVIMALLRALGRYQQALDLGERALQIVEGRQDQPRIAWVHADIGNVYNDLGDIPSALDRYGRALGIYERIGDRSGAVSVTSNRGVLFFKTGDYPAALESFHRALQESIELGDRMGEASALCNVGVVYLTTDNYAESLSYSHRALLIQEELGNQSECALLHNNIGSALNDVGQNARAMEHFERALETYRSLGRGPGIAMVLDNLAGIMMEMDQYDEALVHSERALELHQEHRALGGIAKTTGDMITSLIATGQTDRAESLLASFDTMHVDDPAVRASREYSRAHLQQLRGEHDAAMASLGVALQIATDHQQRAHQAKTHKLMREQCQTRGDFAGYIEHNNEFIRITDEINGKDATTKVAMQEAERRIAVERQEHVKHLAVLHSTLPTSVADRVIRGERVTGDHFDAAAVLFADIVGFTSRTSTMPPSEVVDLLENIFSTFDAICERHGVTKVKTIGDSYMCFKGDADAATNALAIALTALEFNARTFLWPHSTDESVRFRIGLHIGPATAGVIGTQRLQYDVWGDTVNVASRMESSGEAGRVHVSAAFAANLKRNTEYRIQNSMSESENQESQEVSHVTSHSSLLTQLVTGNLSLVTIDRGFVDIKGKGLMQTHWLEGSPS